MIFPCLSLLLALIIFKNLFLLTSSGDTNHGSRRKKDCMSDLYGQESN